MDLLQNFRDNSEQAELKEFWSEEVRTSSINDMSMRNISAKAAMLSGENLMDVFTRINTQMSEGDNSYVLDIVGKADQNIKEDNKSIAVEVMSDTTVSEEEKTFIAENWLKSTEETININTALGTKMIEADSSPFESVEDESVRIDMSTHFNEVNAYRAEVQKYINGEAAKNNPKTLSNLADLLEVVVPFAEGAALSKIINDLRGGDKVKAAEAFVLLGNSKEKLADWFAKIPRERRLELIPSIIEVVKSSDTIIYDETNDLLRNDFLRSIIDEGYYTETDKIIDNVVSILDLVGVGAALKGIFGRGTKISKTVKPSKTINNINITKKLNTSNFINPDRFSKKPSSTGTDVVPKGTSLKTQGKSANWEPVVNPKLGVDLSIEDLRKKSVRTSTQPTSVSQNMKDTNPQNARKLHAAMSSDETGKVAESTYGTTRAEAVADDLMPEVPTSDGSMASKLSEPDALIEQVGVIGDKTSSVEDVVRYTKAEQGAIYYKEKEKAAARARVVNDFQNVTGMTARKEMFQWDKKADGLRVKAAYGPTEGGFKSPQEAVELAALQLRQYGVDARDISLMKRVGDSYKPVDPKIKLEDLPDGDYLVSVDYRYKFDPNSMIYEGGVDVKWNVFDRTPFLRSGKMNAGGIQTWLLDAASMFNPIISKSANVQVDKSSRLKKMLGDSTSKLEKGFNKLSSERSEKLTNLWKEANAKGFDIDDAKATAEGLTVEEKALSDLWRSTWDAMWHLENEDLKKSLRAKGYKVYHNKANKDRLFVIPQKFKGRGARVYDPKQDKIVQIPADELKNIYDKGGEVGKLKTEIEVNGEKVNKILSHNDTNGYIRAFNDYDSVLNYRKGYYQVHYKDPFFIEEVGTKANGEVYRTAKATARNQQEAEMMAKRMSSKTGKTYKARQDKFQTTITGDSAFESIIASGRTAQRLRGKRLEDASGAASMEAAHLMDPSEALAQSIQSVSNRVEMRDWLDATKARFVSQFRDVLPKDEKGRVLYPSTNKEILPENSLGGVKSIKELNKEAADAASLWEYIRSMEDGYINHVDEGFKSIMNSVADIFAGTSNPVLNRFEEFARNRANGLGPTNFGKKTAFQLYLALNPLRQIVVQSHQMIQIAGIEPAYLFSRLVPEATVLTSMINYFESGKVSTKLMDKKFGQALKRLDMTSAEAVQLYKDWSNSGLGNAVDTHNLVRSNWEYSTRGDFLTGTGRLVDKAVEPFQRIGFDAGERANIMSSWLAFRHRAKKAGKNINDKAVVDEIVGEARNFTYNMNKAGDMPYNANGLALAMQFLQVPHKAVTQVLFNRQLTKAERIRMGLFNTMAYGVPALWLVDNYFSDILPDDEDARRAMQYGLETVVLNKIFEGISGQDVDIDWTNLAPVDMYGTMDTVHMLLTSPMEALANAPAAQLVGSKGRITELVKSAGRVIGLVEDYEEDPTTFGRVALDFAKLSSGFSNGLKAYYALEANRKLNSYGDEDYAASTTEAILQAFGFRTLEEAREYEVSVKLSEDYKSRKEDITKWWKDYKKHLNAEGKPVKYYMNIQKTYNEIFRVFPKDRITTQIIDTLLRRDIEDNDTTFYKRVFGNIDWMDEGELKDIIRSYEGMEEEDKKDMMERIEVIRNFRKE